MLFPLPIAVCLRRKPAESLNAQAGAGTPCTFTAIATEL
jgi:hypothetical protein